MSNKRLLVHELKEAVKLLGPYSSRDHYTNLLNQCGEAKALEQGKSVHAHILHSRLRSNTYIANHLVKMYGSCGDTQNAACVFRSMHQKNVFSWNIMLTAYSQNGQCKQVTQLFHEMLQEGSIPDNITFINVLAACETLSQGILLHMFASESQYIFDVVVGTSVINMYGRFKEINRAKEVFHSMPVRNVISWTAFITAYSQCGLNKQAVAVYMEMEAQGIKPDRVTFVSVLDACTALEDGKWIHKAVVSQGFSKEFTVMNALLTMYARCGSLVKTREVFDKEMCLFRNDISWTALIAAYAQYGHLEQVLELVKFMSLDGFIPDGITYINVLFACSHAGSVYDAFRCFLEMIGDYYVDPVADHYVCMLDLLGRVGQLELVEDLVKYMPFHLHQTVWRSFLSACGTHGDYQRGFTVANIVLRLDNDELVHSLLRATCEMEPIHL